MVTIRFLKAVRCGIGGCTKRSSGDHCLRRGGDRRRQRRIRGKLQSVTDVGPPPSSPEKKPAPAPATGMGGVLK